MPFWGTQREFLDEIRLFSWSKALFAWLGLTFVSSIPVLRKPLPGPRPWLQRPLNEALALQGFHKDRLDIFQGKQRPTLSSSRPYSARVLRSGGQSTKSSGKKSKRHHHQEDQERAPRRLLEQQRPQWQPPTTMYERSFKGKRRLVKLTTQKS